MEPTTLFTVIPRYSAVLAIVIVVALLASWLLRDRRLDGIPGPRGYPLIGIGYQLPSDTANVFRRWASMYGDVFKVRVGFYDWIVINSPAAMREILEKQSAHTSSKAPSPMSHDTVTRGHRMPTMPYGPDWRAMRALVREVTAVPITATFMPCQEFEAKQLLFDLATNNAGDRAFYQHMRRYALSIINTNTFGRRVQTLEDPAALTAIKSQGILRSTSRPGSFIVDEVPLLARLPRWLQPGRQAAEKAASEIWAIKIDLWRRFETQISAGTAPYCYAKEVYQNRETWYARGLSEAHLVWLTSGLVEAGFETTASTLNTLVLHLAANPEKQGHARDEIRHVVGSERLPTFEDIPQLPYLRSCVKEALRMNPVLSPGIRHYADRDITYQGHTIPKGTVLLANTAFLHFDPSRFADPFAFVPERYLDHELSSADYAAMGDPYQRDHFTFSTGRRTCPGARLAENSIHIAMAGILWAFEIRPPLLPNGQEARMNLGADMYLDPGFTIPKPFAARFVPFNNEALQLVKDQWKYATEKGYLLRGTPVDVHGVTIS